MKKENSPPAEWASAERLAEQRRLRGRDRSFWASRLFSVQAALAGAAHTLRTQPNAWIELIATVVVCVAGWWFGLSPVEWAILALTFFLVLALEAVNTAIEAVVDLISPGYHPLAKTAKDAAAGAMIFIVLASVAVALAIFAPRFWALIF
ncbi:MAG TPA: diacylglycerol kinase family protein [Caldilineaceae bacterium]|nr:diacylglycerol kinase family protein [Caldilineaceae bacterium]